MQNLSIFYRRAKIFTKLEITYKLLLFKAYILCGIYRMAILIIPFKKLKKHIGTYNVESEADIEIEKYRVVSKVAWAVNTVSKYTPWESKCLVKALTAQKILRKFNIFSTLYLGVSKSDSNKLNAHAWLRCGKMIVTGGGDLSQFTTVAKFTNSDNAK